MSTPAMQLWDNERLRKEIEAEKNAFGTKCHKFAGALTIECMRRAFGQHGIATSPRDVFIDGIPIEIDLMVPRRAACPRYGIVYNPEDVLAVLEIKTFGAFGKNTSQRVRACFDEIQGRHPNIWCAYATLMERESYKYKVTNESINGRKGHREAYTLFWHSASLSNREYTATRDWTSLVNELQNLVKTE
jgi:hypothetical protein